MDEKSPFPLKPQQLLRLLNIGKEEDAGTSQPVEATVAVAGESGAPDRPPPWIGRYKVLEVLGEGGMGIVYLARQEHPIERTVAVKVIKPGMDSKEVIARFETERQALALLDHPNIAQVLDAGTTEAGRPYFAMEYVNGIPVTEYCDKYNLGTKERLRLFIPLCQAIQHAHHQGIIHRDIKPANVLVMLDDEKPIPKIIDFGVAKALNQRLTEKTLFTARGVFVGTPEYMSPEQAELTGLDVDTGTDIYSLGVLLYELLTGCTPFDPEELRSKGYAEMQRIIREQEPVKPSTKLTTLGGNLEDIAKHRSATVEQLRKSVRGDLDWIVMKALEKDRRRRYGTAKSLAVDIERHLNHEPILARPPSRLYRFQKLVRRNKVVFAAGAVTTAAVVALVLAGAGWWLARARTAKPETVEAWLLGLRCWWEASEKSTINAIRYFERAIEIEPDYAPAHAGLALSYIYASTFVGIWEPREGVPKGKAAAQKAIELDPMLADAYVALGFARLNYDWDWAGAERDFQRAIELNPRSSLAQDGYAGFLALRGRFDEGIQVLQRALEFDPLSPGLHHDLGWILRLSGQCDKAIPPLLQAIELDRSMLNSRVLLGACYMDTGKTIQALGELKAVVQLAPDWPWPQSFLGYAYALTGRRDEAMGVLADLDRLAKKRYVAPNEQATVYAGLGRTDAALDLLEQAYRQRHIAMVFLKVEPVFASLRDDLRFRALVEKVENGGRDP